MYHVEEKVSSSRALVSKLAFINGDLMPLAIFSKFIGDSFERMFLCLGKTNWSHLQGLSENIRVQTSAPKRAWKCNFRIVILGDYDIPTYKPSNRP